VKKRNSFLKIFFEIIFLFLLVQYLTNCSKKVQNNIDTQVVQIDLTDTTYHDLLHNGGSLIISKYDIIIGCKKSIYYCANSKCPNCGGTIIFDANHMMDYWVCPYCFTGESGDLIGEWDESGLPAHSGFMSLRVYTISKSGKLLYIHLHL